MSMTRENEVKLFITNHFSEQLTGKGLDPQRVPDGFDLLTEGIIDSLGLIEMITAVESHFGVTVDFEGLPTEHLTVIGPFREASSS